MKDIKGKSWWKFAKICLPSSIGTAAYVSLVRSLVPSQSTRPHHLSDPLPVHSCLLVWQRIFKFNIPMDNVHARAKFQIRCLHNLLGLVIFFPPEVTAVNCGWKRSVTGYWWPLSGLSRADSRPVLCCVQPIHYSVLAVDKTQLPKRQYRVIQTLAIFPPEVFD